MAEGVEDSVRVYNPGTPEMLMEQGGNTPPAAALADDWPRNFQGLLTFQVGDIHIISKQAIPNDL